MRTSFARMFGLRRVRTRLRLRHVFVVARVRSAQRAVRYSNERLAGQALGGKLLRLGYSEETIVGRWRELASLLARRALRPLEEMACRAEAITSDASQEPRTPLASIRNVGEVALQKDGSRAEYRETNRFYRANGSRSRDGAGLGLSTAQWAVRRHGGRTQWITAPGAGCPFQMSLPTEIPTKS